MAKVHFFRCRKCWEDVEVKKIEQAPKACAKCGTELYHHASSSGDYKPKKRVFHQGIIRPIDER